MKSARKEVRKILDQIPDDASLEDIQYHIYICQKIERGLQDMDDGRVLSREQVEKQMSRWIGK